MSEMPDTAMVLSAGLGTRMRPLTDDRPKPLVPVAGKPLVDYALDRFASAGVPRAVVNIHYFADMMEAHLSQRVTPEILISDERDLLLETGGGLKKASALFSGESIFCTNTDAILIDDPGFEACATLSEAWRPEDMDALLLLAPIERASGYEGRGDFNQDKDGRIAFRQANAAPYVFTGLQVLKTALVEIGPDGPFSTRVLWQHALERGRLFGAVHHGDWMHV
ncbi:MAG: nucleotidyltransferase family protein, partial [Pseudomonadota bacterium]